MKTVFRENHVSESACDGTQLISINPYKASVPVKPFTDLCTLGVPKFKLHCEIEQFLPTDLLAALSVVVEDYVAEMVAFAVRRILEANFGSEMGVAVFADLAGLASVPNSVLVPNVSRQAVSRACCRIRDGLDLPLRSATNARPCTAEKL
jgi:hypothetical protein